MKRGGSTPVSQAAKRGSIAVRFLISGGEQKKREKKKGTADEHMRQGTGNPCLISLLAKKKKREGGKGKVFI